MILVEPTHFTVHEGGTWLECPKGYTLNKEALDIPRPGYITFSDPGPVDPALPIFTIRHKDRNYYVHSFAFGDVSKPHYPRWDEFNGWTQPLPAEYQHEH